MEVYFLALAIRIHGTPDFLAVDQGSAYVSKAMRETLSAAGVTLEEAPIETPGWIGSVEGYYAQQLGSTYKELRDYL